MREGMRGFIGGLLAAGGVAAHSGEAMAKPTPEQLELRAERADKDIAWAKEAEVRFTVAYEANDAEAMADIVRDFVREYRVPTQGPVTLSHQHNPMRVLDKGEWGRLREVALGFAAKSHAWDEGYESLRRDLEDVIEGMDRHIESPGAAVLRHPAVSHSKKRYQ